MQEDQNIKEEYSQEEIQKMRSNMTDYYKEQIEFLTIQKEYEILLADIEEARTKRMAMQVRQAQMLSVSQEDEDSYEQNMQMMEQLKQEQQNHTVTKEESEPKKRKLKVNQ